MRFIFNQQTVRWLEATSKLSDVEYNRQVAEWHKANLDKQHLFIRI